MTKLTCPRSTSRDILHSLGIEPPSQISHPKSSTTDPQTAMCKGKTILIIYTVRVQLFPFFTLPVLNIRLVLS